MSLVTDQTGSAEAGLVALEQAPTRHSRAIDGGAVAALLAFSASPEPIAVLKPAPKSIPAPTSTQVPAPTSTPSTAAEGRELVAKVLQPPPQTFSPTRTL